MASMFKVYQKFVMKHRQEEVETTDYDANDVITSVMPNLIRFPGMKYLKRFQNMHSATFKVDTL